MTLCILNFHTFFGATDTYFGEVRTSRLAGSAKNVPSLTSRLSKFPSASKVNGGFISRARNPWELGDTVGEESGFQLARLENDQGKVINLCSRIDDTVAYTTTLHPRSARPQKLSRIGL